MQQFTSSTAGSVAPRFAPRGAASRSRGSALKVAAVKVGDEVRPHHGAARGALPQPCVRRRRLRFWLWRTRETVRPAHAAPDAPTLPFLPPFRRPSLLCVTRCERAGGGWAAGCWGSRQLSASRVWYRGTRLLHGALQPAWSHDSTFCGSSWRGNVLRLDARRLTGWLRASRSHLLRAARP